MTRRARMRDRYVFAMKQSLCFLCFLHLQAAATAVSTDSQKIAVPALSDDAIVLTPWWNLRFSEGETIVLDCGTHSLGDPSAIHMEWRDPQSNVINGSTPVVHLKRDDTISAENRGNTACPTLTLTLVNITRAQSGVYTCHVRRDGDSKGVSFSKNVTIDVSKPATHCGFEGKDTCGWRWNSSQSIQWHWHAADDKDVVNSAKGPRHDHTYGPSKHIGHFVSVDLEHHESEKKSSHAILESPVYSKHDTEKCLQFWFVFQGRDQESLTVKIRPINSASDGDYGPTSTLFSEKNSSSNAWQLTKKTIPAQNTDYQIVIDAATCTGKCRQGVSAVDDLSILDTSCENSTHEQADTRLRLRLLNGSSPNDGRLEVLHDGRWGSICSRQFGDKEAQVACRSLGLRHEKAMARRNATFGSALRNQPIWLQGLSCSGSEEDLAVCMDRGAMWGETQCNHDEDVAVVCRGPTTAEPKAGATKLKSTLPPTTPLTTTTITTTTTKPTDIHKNIVNVNDTDKSGSVKPTPSVLLTSSKMSEKEKTTPISTNQLSTEKTGSTKTRPAAPSTIVPSTSHTKTGVYSTVPASSATLDNPSPESSRHSSHRAGIGILVAIVVLIVVVAMTVLLCKRQKIIKKNAYITFTSPKYRQENLPANDFNMESPLTLSSNGYTVLA